MRQINLDEERKFENRKASGEAVRSAQTKFYWATALCEERHKLRTFNAITEKNILEIGCASGYDAVAYSKYAANYIGVDISNVAIDNCKALCIPNATFHCVDGHRLPAASNSIDCVIVNSLLHHLDLKTAFIEIIRVLKSDGVLIFREPLGTNPLFWFYRKMTPEARTTDERPFTFSDLQLMRAHFNFDGVEWYGFISIISAYSKSLNLRKWLTTIDKLLSYTPIKYLFWQFCGVVTLNNNIR